jgi:hypothetical protein
MILFGKRGWTRYWEMKPFNFTLLIAVLFANDVLAVSGQQLATETAGNASYQIKAGTLGLHPRFDREYEGNGIPV